jgi:integrase/recombinase XerD
MSALSQAVDDDLSVRRALGYKLVAHGYVLPDFIAYLESAGATTISTELAVAWATEQTTGSPVRKAQRLTMVRGFARHMQALDPATEIPPPGLLPDRCRRVAPYIYSDADVVALMTAARALPSPQRAATYETIVGLWSVTGMRCGEAVRLDRDHIDWDEGTVTIWNSKFRKSRALPLHPTTVVMLERYAGLRDEFCARPKAPSFFLSITGTRLSVDMVDLVFRGLVERAGLEHRGGRRPRPHDLRHRFAVRTLLGWYRAGVDVEAHMPLLSTYLGHSHPEHTYWYLSAVPELLSLAAERAEAARP